MFSCEKAFQLCCKRRPTTDVLFWVMLGFARICVPSISNHICLCRMAKIGLSALVMWGRGKAISLARAHVSTVWHHHTHYCKQWAHMHIEEQKRHARDCFDFSFSWGQLQNSSQTSRLGPQKLHSLLGGQRNWIQWSLCVLSNSGCSMILWFLELSGASRNE